MTVVAPNDRPGVRVEQEVSPTPVLDFSTGVAGFVGSGVAYGAPSSTLPAPQPFTSWYDFALAFRDPSLSWRKDSWRPDDWTWAAVQGFFQNGGARCWVSLSDPRVGDQKAALDLAVAALANVDDVDLVCAPSLLRTNDPSVSLEMQKQLLRSFEQRIDWFLLADPPDAGTDLAQRIADLLVGCARPQNIALYHPWIRIGRDAEPPPGATVDRLPPSGHVAGVFSRTDQRVGVQKAPANEPIEGLVDVDDVDDIEGANPLRAFPGRGIRVWGARTLAPVKTSDPRAFVNVRRLILTLERWLVRAFDWATFEENDFKLWVRVQRELTAKLTDLFLRGAFAGKTPDEAFVVKCDAENNPDDVRARGELHVDVRVAPAVPKEFVTIRVVRDAEGVSVT